ncbi:MAG: glycosyltransferase family 2 protein [Thiotrichaceae bacterium]|nr:glycosyltransferase family 2 protein [Thiotrichaceae bacterium]
MTSLSVIIITRNAAKHIENCLKSIEWADEIIIVDSGSDDNTLNICRQYTQQVFSYPDWQGFGVQKNRALSHATGDWILSIDADEHVPPELRAEIEQAIVQQNDTAWMLPRLSRYCGRWIRYSWGKDYVLRLFQRDCGKFTDDLVHERVTIHHGLTGKLNTPLLHFSFSSVEEVLQKVNAYSTASAQMQFQRNKKSSLSRAVLHGLWAFVRSYVFKRGFLDGREGFILAVSNAEGTYYRYIKLMYLQERYESQHYSKHL